jgi:hypothetical protein
VNDTFIVTADNSGDWIVEVDPDYFAANQNNLTFSIYGSSAMNDPIVIYNAAYGDVYVSVFFIRYFFLLLLACTSHLFSHFLSLSYYPPPLPLLPSS